MRRIRSATARAALLGISTLFAVPLAAGLPMTPAYARATPDSFADLAARLLPAVVNVASSQLVTAHNGGPGGGGPGAGPEMPLFPPGSPFEQFFKDFLIATARVGRAAVGVVVATRRRQSTGCRASGRASSSTRPG